MNLDILEKSVNESDERFQQVVMFESIRYGNFEARIMYSVQEGKWIRNQYSRSYFEETLFNSYDRSCFHIMFDSNGSEYVIDSGVVKKYNKESDTYENVSLADTVEMIVLLRSVCYISPPRPK